MDRTTCPVAAVTQLLGARWTLLILHHLRQRRRYGELRSRVGDVNPRTFTQRLRMLEEAGLIRRLESPDRARHVEYELTQAGQELMPILDQLAAWSRRWLTAQEVAPP